MDWLLLGVLVFLCDSQNQTLSPSRVFLLKTFHWFSLVPSAGNQPGKVSWDFRHVQPVCLHFIIRIRTNYNQFSWSFQTLKFKTNISRVLPDYQSTDPDLWQFFIKLCKTEFYTVARTKKLQFCLRSWIILFHECENGSGPTGLARAAMTLRPARRRSHDSSSPSLYVAPKVTVSHVRITAEMKKETADSSNTQTAFLHCIITKTPRYTARGCARSFIGLQDGK